MATKDLVPGNVVPASFKNWAETVSDEADTSFTRSTEEPQNKNTFWIDPSETIVPPDTVLDDPRVPPTPVGQDDGRILVVNSEELVYEGNLASVRAAAGVSSLVAADSFNRSGVIGSTELGGFEWTSLFPGTTWQFFNGPWVRPADTNEDGPKALVIQFAESIPSGTGFVAEATTSIDYGDSHGLILAVDEDNYIAAEVSSGGVLKMYKCIDGTVTEVASQGGTAGSWTAFATRVQPARLTLSFGREGSTTIRPRFGFSIGGISRPLAAFPMGLTVPSASAFNKVGLYVRDQNRRSFTDFTLRRGP